MDDFSPRPTSLARSLSSGKAVRPEETNRPMRLSRSSSDPDKSFMDKEQYLAKRKVAFPEELKSATRYDDEDDPYEGCFDDYDYDEPFTNPCYEGYYGEDDSGEDDQDDHNTNSNSFAPTDNGTASTGHLHVPSSSGLETMLQDQSSTPHHIPLRDLKEITNNFSDGRILGHGGSGVVYKGVLRNGKTVVVKKIVSSLIPGLHKQFESEVCHLMMVKHPNIVRCIGYCYETRNECLEYNGQYVFAEMAERLLCLEYLPKGSLDKYISDFGLSRLFGRKQTICTASCVGTFGYMAPEFLHGGIITPKLDIFSLGVMIMEIITGHRNYPQISGTSSNDFIELALDKWSNVLQRSTRYGFLEMDRYQIKGCIHVGLICVNPDRNKRPPIAKIINMLEGLESIDCTSSNKVA